MANPLPGPVPMHAPRPFAPSPVQNALPQSPLPSAESGSMLAPMPGPASMQQTSAPMNPVPGGLSSTLLPDTPPMNAIPESPQPNAMPVSAFSGMPGMRVGAFGAPNSPTFPQTPVAAPPAVPAAIAPVVPTVGATPVPPPPTLPPPPELIPYLVPGESITEQQYVYGPPPATHVLAGARRIQSPPNTVMPPGVDLRGLLEPVRDARDNSNNPEGYATAALREEIYVLTANARLPGRLSPRYLYLAHGNSHATVADEMLTLMQRGICPDAWVDEGIPEFRRNVAALPFRIREPAQIDLSDVRNIKFALMNKLPIVVNFTVFASWERPGEGGALAMFDPTEPVLGAHAVLVVGFNDMPERGPLGWLVLTSAGETWGDKGYVTMPYGYEVTWLEAWTIVG